MRGEPTDQTIRDSLQVNGTKNTAEIAIRDD